jgi:hypothetical protein
MFFSPPITYMAAVPPTTSPDPTPAERTNAPMYAPTKFPDICATERNMIDLCATSRNLPHNLTMIHAKTMQEAVAARRSFLLDRQPHFFELAEFTKIFHREFDQKYAKAVNSAVREDGMFELKFVFNAPYIY